MISYIISSTLITAILSNTCDYSSDNLRAYDRLANDQETTLIPKICGNGVGCLDDVCARDPAILTEDVGCIWCEDKEANTCNEDPSNEFEDPDDYYFCYSTTTESCGCVDDRPADVVVLMDVTDQTIATFYYYLMYFSWWYSEKLLPQTPETNLRYILFTDEVIYNGDAPYDEYGFEYDEDTQTVVEQDELPSEVDGADTLNVCPALEAAVEFFDDDGEHTRQLLYYISTSDVDADSVEDCEAQTTLLDGIETFTFRFWQTTNMDEFEDTFGDVTFCEYFQKTSYDADIGNANDARYFVNLMSDFICEMGGVDTVDPTNDPTNDPTEHPSVIPTADPTEDPTKDPTTHPTIIPSALPTELETTLEPTSDPTEDPTEDPTADPTENPSEDPTEDPSSDPSANPSWNPTWHPTEEPTDKPKVWWNNGDNNPKHHDKEIKGHPWQKPPPPQNPWWNQQQQPQPWNQQQQQQQPWWNQQQQQQPQQPNPWWNQQPVYQWGQPQKSSSSSSWKKSSSSHSKKYKQQYQY